MRLITDTQTYFPVAPAFMDGSDIGFNLFDGAMIPSPIVSVAIDLKYGPNIIRYLAMCFRLPDFHAARHLGSRPHKVIKSMSTFLSVMALIT